MDYSLYILGHAERDIKKLKKQHPQLASNLADRIRKLSQNPRPERCQALEGQADLYRIHFGDGKFRIIYSILDDPQAIIIVAIRRRNESTYKKIDRKNLSEKIKSLNLELKETISIVADLARKIGIEWIANLDDDQVRILAGGIQAITGGRSSLPTIAVQIQEAVKVKEDIKTITRDMKRLLQEM
ncbi:MAG: type II toxin-antitoxin system RelE/ParE family toxin [Desulfomonile tiedjei]|nr:type II toxin-antitoxin system RelE/ParE family toxin [Desulfomonile tiedjei]